MLVCEMSRPTHMTNARICIAHVEQYGACLDMPPPERQDQPMVSISYFLVTMHCTSKFVSNLDFLS